MIITVGNSRIELLHGDITEQSVDAIVNAANSRLAGGGGVDGAIHRRGGPTIMDETRRRYAQGCRTGSAVSTGAGELSAKFVFHAVGPVWQGGQRNEPDLLRATYQSCLQLCVEHDCESIAFPAISSGAYGYPFAEAAEVALQTCIEHAQKAETPFLIQFVLFDRHALSIFDLTLKRLTSDWK